MVCRIKRHLHSNTTPTLQYVAQVNALGDGYPRVHVPPCRPLGGRARVVVLRQKRRESSDADSPSALLYFSEVHVDFPRAIGSGGFGVASPLRLDGVPANDASRHQRRR